MPPRNRARWPAFATATGRVTGLALVAVAAAMSAEAPEPAVIAPLAVRSLLLGVTALPDGHLVAVGERGHALISTDGGRSWRQSAVPSSSTLTAVHFADATHGWAVGHDETILRTEDGGRSWQLTHWAPERQAPLLDVWFDATGHGVAVGAFAAVYRSADGGRTWNAAAFDPQPLAGNHGPAKAKVADPMADDEGISQPHLNAIAGDGHGRLYVAGEAGHLYRSDDGGERWFVLPSPYAGSYFGLLPLEGDVVLAFGLRGHLYRSEDAGRSWATVSTGTEALLSGGTRLMDGTIVVVGLAGVVLVSHDTGRSFSLLQQPNRKGLSAVAAAPGGIVVAGDGGVKTIALSARAPGG